MIETLRMSLSSTFPDLRTIWQNLRWVLWENLAPMESNIKKIHLRLSEMMLRIKKLTLLCLEMDLNLLSCACGVASRHFYCGMQTVPLQVKEIYKEAYN